MASASGRLVTGLAAAELPLILLIAPALLFPSPMRLLVLLLVPPVWLCAWRTGRHIIPSTPLNASLLLLLTMVGVSLVATFDVRFSLGKVSGVIFGVLVFWAVTRWVTTPFRLAIATGAFLLAGVGLSIIGLLGTSWFDKFPLLGFVIDRLPKAIRGVPGAEEGFHPNPVGGCLVLFIPLQIALLAGTAGGWLPAHASIQNRRTLLLLGQATMLALTAGTLLLTQSRGAWVGLLGATIVFFAWHSRQSRAFAATLAGASVILALALGPARLSDLAISQSGPGMAANVSGRLELWSRGIYAVQDFPITGMGMNVFRKAMPILYPTFLTSPDLDVAHAHNHLLQAALDLGIPGLIAYLSIWTIVGMLLVAVYRRSTERAYRAMAGGLGSGLIAHFGFSMTDAIPLGAKVGVLFWLTLALSVALHRVAIVSSGAQPDRPQPTT